MGTDVTDMGQVETPHVNRNLKKHASMVHCSNTLSLLQRKISNALLFHAYDNLLIQEEHFITVKELSKLTGFNSNNDKSIKDALKGLMTTLIEWNVVNDDIQGEDWTASTILASVHLQGPNCYYAYSPRMKMLLHSPSMYAKINLFIQSHFQSQYGLALYENCIRYIGLQSTRWFDIKLFRKIMGVSDDIYLIFRDFKRRVLDKAIDEVNSYSNIFIVPEYQRRGREVVRLRFHLKEREKKKKLGATNVDFDSNEGENIQLNELLTVFNFDTSSARKLIQKYGEPAIQEKIKLVRSLKTFQQDKVKNPAGLLTEALSKNYKSVNQNIKEDMSIKINNSDKCINKSKFHEEYRKYFNENILSLFGSKSLNEQEQLLGLFEKFLGSSLYKDIYVREGMNNVIIQEQFCEFVRSSVPEFITNILSFEKYIESRLDIV